MRIGYLDCFAGVAGDMWVGALLDAGLPLAELEAAVAGLALPGIGIRSEAVSRAGLRGCQFHVDVDPARRAHHRHLADIEAILAAAPLPDAVRARAVEVFGVLAKVEAAAHGMPIERVHFHEVGAEDAIVDVVCACLGTHLLGIERLYASAVTVGTGTVDCAHGTLPVPPPGALGNLFGIPVRSGAGRGECTTPTGAALLRVLVDEFEPQLTWVPERCGYGAGTRDDPGLPNLLRLTLGEAGGQGAVSQIFELTVTVDTATGEDLGHLLERVRAAGALDAFAIAVQMKKGRPGYQITVLVDPAHREPITALLLEESTSLGVRVQRAERTVLERWSESLETEFGPVRYKCVRAPSGAVSRRAEDDEVRRIAEQRSLAPREVRRRLDAGAAGSP